MQDAHVLAIIVLGVCSFTVGAIPLKISTIKLNNLFLSLLLCCGAGVLLATSVVHMLKEIHENLGKNSEIYFCAGFLLLYAVDECIHLILGGTAHLAHADIERPVTRSSATSSDTTYSKSSDDILLKTQTSYGTLERVPKTKKYIAYTTLPQTISKDESCSCCCQSELKHRRHTFHDFYYLPSEKRSEEKRDSHESSKKEATVALHGLLIALLLHSFLEGTSVGVQTNSSKIVLVTVAITCHKLVLALCLGLELVAVGFKGLKYLSVIAAFAIGCPIGIGFGVTLTQTGEDLLQIEAPLQAIAAGSLLFVAIFEVLPREKYKWQHKSECRWAGTLQMIAVVFGFSMITIINSVLEHSHQAKDNKDSPAPSSDVYFSDINLSTNAPRV